MIKTLSHGLQRNSEIFNKYLNEKFLSPKKRPNATNETIKNISSIFAYSNNIVKVFVEHGLLKEEKGCA